MNAHSARWLRRSTAFAAAVGLILMSSLAPAAALTGASAARQAAPGCPGTGSSGTGSAVTVTGPKMYDPKTKTLFNCPSVVTVSQTKDLVNQMIQVSWQEFTPSKGIPYQQPSTLYPVEVAECPGDSPGTSPADLAKCYYAANQGQPYTNGKYGPSNDVDTTTTPQGTGYADIQIETYLQNQGLDCSGTQDCSLLILPVQGGEPGDTYTGQKPDCSNHSNDDGSFQNPILYASASATLDVPAGPFGDTCSWQDRIVVPLHFAPTSKNCGFSNPAFSVAGSPMLARAMTSWQSGLCHGAHPDPFSYDGTVGEPQARSIFQAGGDDDVALTTEPASGLSRHPFTYAPVGISAAAIAYWVDDVKTGQPYTDLKLNPLLLTKLLTQSYTYGFACTPAELQHPPTTPPGCDPGVLHDPEDLLSDPEFRQLNPGLDTYTSGVPRMVPTVMQGNSDMTWEVTRWMAADQTSTNFLAGHVDNWGEHVNTFYLNSQYPTTQFVAQDNTGPTAFTYLPVYPPSKVATYQVDNWLPGISWTPQICGTEQCNPPDPVEIPGQRSLLAILDEPDAASFLLPTMKIENAAGDYVAPTAASMAAAVKDMIPNGPGGITKQYNEASKDPAAYPLTMVVYAMVPTGGISHYKATKIAQWLDYVAGAGQHQGYLPGQLPPGYLPLTSSMRAQTRKAAYEVLHQTGGQSSGHGGSNPGGNGGGGGGSGSNSGSSSQSQNNNSHDPGATPSSSPGATAQGKANAAFSSPYSGTDRMVLVILLVVGGLLALAGPAAVVLGKPGGRAAIASGWHRVLALRHGPRFLRGGK